VRVADLTASPALLPERVAAETAASQRALDAAEAVARACAAEYAAAVRALERERGAYEALLRRLDEARDRAWALEDGELKTAAGAPFARKHARGALSLLTKAALAELRRGRGRVPPLAGRGGATGSGSGSYAASSGAGAGAGYGRAGGSATSLGAEFSEYAASTGLSGLGGLSGSGGHDVGVYPAIALPAALPAEPELVTAADLAPLMEEAVDAVERTRKETEATLKAQVRACGQPGGAGGDAGLCRQCCGGRRRRTAFARMLRCVPGFHRRFSLSSAHSPRSAFLSPPPVLPRRHLPRPLPPYPSCPHPPPPLPPPRRSTLPRCA